MACRRNTPVFTHFSPSDQRHVPVQLGIGGTVDLSHAALANFLKNLVVRDRLGRAQNPPHAMQLRSMVSLRALEGNGKGQQAESRCVDVQPLSQVSRLLFTSMQKRNEQQS